MSNQRPAARNVLRRKVRDIYGEHLKRARRAGHGGRRSGPFRRFARAASSAVGRPWAFIAATLTVVLWGALGPIFHYSDTWQLVINTGTTIVTFLMVFLIQNTQNRDTEALRLKLDELIIATEGARNEFVDIDDLDDDELAELEQELHRVAESRGNGNHAPLPHVTITDANGSEAKH